MRLTRMLLRNYRAYDELDLELPPGLLGIYGANGSGKTTLLEAITFTLYGRARTPKDEVRTSGVNADCVAEVEFEHDGHLYRVSRSITGVNATVKAHAHADGAHVAEGVRDTDQYVRSVLGMDDAAFRASVFTEQKQLDAFSSKRPAERQKLVLRLLGITPLDDARDEARRDSKARQKEYERLRDVLPDLDALGAELAAAEAAEAVARAEHERAQAEVATAQAHEAASRSRFDDLTSRRHEYDALVAEGKALREQHDKARARVEQLTSELAGLADAEAELARLLPDAEGFGGAEARLRGVEAVERASAALAALAVPEIPVPPDEEGSEAAGRAAVEVATRLAELEAVRRVAQDQVARAHELVGKAADLSGEGDCPLCGQELGAAFEQVRLHRAEELAVAEARVRELDEERAQVVVLARTAESDAAAAAQRLKEARTAWALHERMLERRAGAGAALAEALAAVGAPPQPGELESLRSEVERRRTAAEQTAVLRGRLERRVKAQAALDVEAESSDAFAGRLEALREKVRSLAFVRDELAAAEQTLAAATAAAEAARAAVGRIGADAAGAAERVAQTKLRLTQAGEQHERLADLGEEARHLGRLAELLHAFRNVLVGAAGPRLSTTADDIFGVLTDRQYDRLEVDAETYEIQIRDAGRLHGMDRFSGSETDLANLALRIAISEHVRFQSGGQVGLLVLDEVFGSLDDDRRGRLLSVLERLRGRFRQILVVTHSNDVKEQLPQAIEVVRIGDRRAEARLLV